MSANEVLDVLEHFPKQCREAYHIARNVKVPQQLNCIAFLGVGGSSLPAELIRSYVDFPIPLIIVRDYELPKCVNHDSLVFAISYSGDTEETIALYKEAFKRKAKVISISSGGKLRDLCKQNETVHIEVPQGLQPRDAIGYQTIPILNILHTSGFLKNYDQEIEDAFPILEKDYKTQAKDIALKLVDKIPLIYASHKLASLARIWKISLNENAKIMAFFNEFPELNHNEMTGSTQLKGNFYCIMLMDERDHPKIRNRMEITKRLLQDNGCPVLVIKLNGRNLLAKLFQATYLGKWVAYFVSQEYGVDPQKVTMQEQLKKELERMKTIPVL